MKKNKKENIDDAVNCLLELADVHTFTLEVKRHNFYKDSRASANIKVGKIADEIIKKLDLKNVDIDNQYCRTMIYDTIVKYLRKGLKN